MTDRKTPMMKCGHAANSTHDEKPACAICAGISPGAYIVDETPPDLTGRIAKCPYTDCDSEKPSSTNLAFFEYQGEGSHNAQCCKNCGIRHPGEAAPDHAKHRCKGYDPRGDVGYDQYYCGCKGWN